MTLPVSRRSPAPWVSLRGSVVSLEEIAGSCAQCAWKVTGGTFRVLNALSRLAPGRPYKVVHVVPDTPRLGYQANHSVLT